MIGRETVSSRMFRSKGDFVWSEREDDRGGGEGICIMMYQYIFFPNGKRVLLKKFKLRNFPVPRNVRAGVA